jgi:hypothetical protein
MNKAPIWTLERDGETPQQREGETKIVSTKTGYAVEISFGPAKIRVQFATKQEALALFGMADTPAVMVLSQVESDTVSALRNLGTDGDQATAAVRDCYKAGAGTFDVLFRAALAKVHDGRRVQ